MIICDYCRRAAVRRVHVVDEQAWCGAVRDVKYADVEAYQEAAEHYKRLLSAHRHSCWDHLADAYEHVVGRVDPGVPVVLDAEL